MSEFKILSLSATSSMILKALEEKGALHYQVIKRAPSEDTVFISPIVDGEVVEDTVITLVVDGPVRLLGLREVVALDLEGARIVQNPDTQAIPAKLPGSPVSDMAKPPVESPVRRMGCSKAYMPTN